MIDGEQFNFYHELGDLLTDMPNNIMIHSLRVMKRAFEFAETLELANPNIELDYDLIGNGALFHDCKKLNSYGQVDLNHEYTAESTIMERGHPKLAEVVGAHTPKSMIDRKDPSYESRLIYIADTTIMNGNSCLFWQRLIYAMDQYGAPFERVLRCFEHTLDLLEDMGMPQLFIDAHFKGKNKDISERLYDVHKKYVKNNGEIILNTG